MRKLLLSAVGACALIWGAARDVHAGAISLNFHGGASNNAANGNDVAVGDGAGAFYYNVTNWNNVSAPPQVGGPVGGLRDNFGNVTTADVSWSAVGTWDLPSIATSTTNGQSRLMNGYLDTDNTSTTAVTFNNIPYARYDVVVYADGDNGTTSRVGSYTIGGQTIHLRDGAGQNFGTATYVQGYSPTDPGRANPAINSPAGNNAVPEGNYAVFRGVTGSSFTLNATAGSAGTNAIPPAADAAFPSALGHRAPVNGIQIVESVPNPIFFAQNEFGGYNAYEVRLDSASQSAAMRMAQTMTFPGYANVAANPFVTGHLPWIADYAENESIRQMLLNNAWIGATDSPTFGGGDSFAVTNNNSGGAIPTNNPGDVPIAGQRGFGYVWAVGANGTTPIGPVQNFNYQIFSGAEPNDSGANVGEDGLEMRVADGGAWNDLPNGEGPQNAMANNSRNWVVEYDLDLPELPVPDRLPGPDGGNGFFGIRHVRGYTAANGQLGHVQQAEGFVRSGVGTITDTTASMVNYIDPTPSGATGGGRFANDPITSTFPNDTAADDNDFAVVAKGTIRIPAGQGGPWTFGVNGDDGFRLRVIGQNFRTFDYQLGTTRTRIQGDMLEMTWPRGSSDSLGTVDLPEGDYEVELLFFERSGGASVELFAAPGEHHSFFNVPGAPVGAGLNASTFKLVGSTGTGATTTLAAPANGIRIQGNSFLVREVRRSIMFNNAAAGQVTSITDAINVINTPPAYAEVEEYSARYVNLHDPQNSNQAGDFMGDQPFATDFYGDTNDIAVRATALLVITEEDDYTLAARGDDGIRLRLLDPDGAGGVGAPQSSGLFQYAGATGAALDNNPATDGTGYGGFLRTGGVTGAAIVFHLPVGTYPLEMFFYERGGGAFVELAASRGARTAFNTNDFFLLGLDAPVVVTDADGLQLVPEPGSFLLAGLGLIGMIIGLRRRKARG